MTNRDKIISTLSNSGNHCDDCLSEVTEVFPRQQVNQICRVLESRGKLTRIYRATCPRCGKYKLVNQWIN